MDPLWEITQKYCQIQETCAHPALLHISGENAVGKTTLLLRFLEYRLSSHPGAIYLLDTEGKFTKDRLQRLSPHLDRVFCHPVASYDHLQHVLSNLKKDQNQNPTILPGSIIVIHSLSTLIRHSLALSDDYANFLLGYRKFTEEILPQLISLSLTLHTHLILTHHVAYDPTYGENRPAFYDLMQNLQGMWWFLTRTPIKQSEKGLEYSHAVKILFHLKDASPQSPKHLNPEIFRVSFPYLL